MHDHSGYSDGWPGTTPATYYARGRADGLDFMVGDRALRQPRHPDHVQRRLHRRRPWRRTASRPTRTRCASGTRPSSRPAPRPTPNFTGLRGFEWTSDRFGHINVYFSKNKTNAKIDGGYATMETFYKWFTTTPQLGGGADGLATFNHPGDKKLHGRAGRATGTTSRRRERPRGRRADGRHGGLQRRRRVRDDARARPRATTSTRSTRDGTSAPWGPRTCTGSRTTRRLGCVALGEDRHPRDGPLGAGASRPRCSRAASTRSAATPACACSCRSRSTAA